MSNLVFNASLVGDWFYNLWISLWLLIDNIVYVCINWMYRVFILVSKVDIFGGGGQIEEIVERLYLIVGIAMLFIFAYNLILLIINPEGNQLGNMGKVIQNALISIVLVTLLPLIFSYMSTIQSHIIDSNVIGHIILGTSNDPDADPDNKKAGVDTAMTIFSAFYHPKDETLYSCKKGGTAAMCDKYKTVYKDAYDNDDITSFIWNADLKDGLKKGDMEYTYFLSSAAGIFALWMFISFGLDIGIRVGKLAFYQLISPIPVMMRILPGDKMFGKWFSGLKDTYISLFVRLAVIYFCMHAITLVPDVLSGMWATSGDNVIILALANVLVILGILKFAQEAPKLIGDLFGGGGSLSFGIAKKYKEAAKPLSTVADMGRSGIYSKLYGGANGEGGSFFAGAWRGRKGYEKGVAATDARSEALTNGSTLRGRMMDRARIAVGMKTRYEDSGANTEKQLKKQRIEDREKHNSSFMDAVESFNKVAEKIATASDSQYRSDMNGYEHTDSNGRTYSLKGKNYFEMQEVIADAERNNVESSEIIEMKKYMEQHRKDQIKAIKDQQLRVGTVNASSSLQEEIKKSQSLISEAIKDGAAETVDANGKLVSHVSEADLANANALKQATDRVKTSNDDISQTRRDITRRDASHKAKRADSEAVRNKNNK